jgi:hypothetical protein
MDNMITGILSAAVFIAFVAGLAESIGAIPFMIIVAIVCVMMLTDLVQSIKQESSQRNPKNDD